MNASGFGMVPTATSHGVEKASVLADYQPDKTLRKKAVF